MIKFDRADAGDYYKAPVDAAFAFPAAASGVSWAIGFVIDFAGLTTGDNAQYIMATGSYQQAGSFIVAYMTEGAANSLEPNRIVMYTNTATGAVLRATNPYPANSKVLAVIQCINTNVTLYHCPILANDPVDGSAVVSNGTGTRSAELSGPAGMYIGSNPSAASNRMLDQSISRVFRINGTLTTLEIAKLAYGKEITELGKNPLFYLRMDTPDDYVNRGTSTVQFTKFGTPRQGNPVGFGYTPGVVTPPVIMGNPVITGTAKVGVSVGYTPASVTNSNGRTQQWYINGVAINGANGPTYTPITSDTGKTLTIQQIETGTEVVTSISPGVVVAEVTNDTLSLNLAPDNDRIYQRNNGAAVVPIGGTYVGSTVASIEYQLYKEDGVTTIGNWTAISAITDGTNWNADAQIPQGGMYRIAVRSKSPSGSVLANSAIHANVFGVGDLFAVVGSSSAEKRFDSTGGTGLTPYANIRKFNENGWSKFGTVGCAIIEANSLAAQAGVPVGMLDYGVGGTTLTQWLGNGTSWTGFINGLTAIGKKIAGAMIFVGSNDANDGVIASKASHKTNMMNFITRIRDFCEQPTLPILISGFNRRTSTGVTDDEGNYIRMAENELGNEPNIYHVQTLDFTLSGDGVHLVATSDGFPASANRNSYVFGNALYQKIYKRGPKIVSMNYEGAVINVGLVHRNGDDFYPVSGITGFTVTDDNGTPTILSVSRDADNKIIITCDRNLVNPKVTYLAGKAPAVGTQVFDNGDMQLPMHMESEMLVNAGAYVPPVTPTTGKFTSYQLTSSGTIRRNQPCKYTWVLNGIIGVATGTMTHGDAVLSNTGVLTAINLPLGNGYMLMKFNDGGVAYQEGTVVA